MSGELGPFKLDERQRILVREHGGGYGIYDYPKEMAVSLAAKARELFQAEFLAASPSVGIAVDGLTRVGMHYHLQNRGTPVLNVTVSERYGTSILVGEGPNGEIAIEVTEHAGEQKCDNATYSRFTRQLRGPGGAVLSTVEELRE